MNIPGMDQPKLGQKNQALPEDLLDDYGFKIKDDIVQEPRFNVPGPIPMGGQMYLANYPTFVAATQMAPGHSITEHVSAVVFPFSSSIELAKDKQPGLSMTALAQTSQQAWRQSGFFLFNPQPNQQPKPGDDHGPFTLAYAAQGKLKSAYAGKSHPNETGQMVPPPDPNQSSAPGEERPINESSGPVRLVVIGNSQFVADDYMRFARQIPVYGGNLLFTMNLLDWMMQDETLAPIRAKGVAARPLAIGSDSTPTVVKYANVVGVPLLFILFGVARWQVRSARRRNAKL
jgi:ABC-type uncharacterized transport system involved in gliding motility auxiliary subunit